MQLPKMQLPKFKWDGLKHELLIEFALVFSLYMYSVCALACYANEYIKYDCVKAVIHSKTYFGMEKDACVPTKPMNGVCMGVVFTYKTKEYTGYVQVDHDKYKIGNKIDLCIEKADPSMFTLSKKRDVVKLLYWFFLSILLVMLTTIKLTLWSGKPIFNKLLLANVSLGLIFFMITLMRKN